MITIMALSCYPIRRGNQAPFGASRAADFLSGRFAFRAGVSYGPKWMGPVRRTGLGCGQEFVSKRLRISRLQREETVMDITNTDQVTSGRHPPVQKPPATPTPTEKVPAVVPTGTVEAGEGEQTQLASVQALVAGLRGDFARAGIVPPPKKYAGLDVVSQGELAQAKAGEDGPSVGTLDKMRIIMVRNILSRVANEQADVTQPDETADVPDGTSHLNLTA
jgi:hypothetical protein